MESSYRINKLDKTTGQLSGSNFTRVACTDHTGQQFNKFRRKRKGKQGQKLEEAHLKDGCQVLEHV
jgi:hypothetical protein